MRVRSGITRFDAVRHTLADSEHCILKYDFTAIKTPMNFGRFYKEKTGRLIVHFLDLELSKKI